MTDHMSDYAQILLDVALEQFDKATTPSSRKFWAKRVCERIEDCLPRQTDPAALRPIEVNNVEESQK